MEFSGVNNYVDLGDIYDDLYPPFTISAWIFLDESAQGWAPIFASQDNAAVYKGTVFLVSKDKIGIEYGDGRGWNNPQFRRSIGATVGDITNQWMHVTGIIRGATDMDLFINGINVSGSYSGSTPYPMVNRKGDVAKIGAWYSNHQRFWFNGKIDELRMWNYSRSEEEIRNDMCKKLQGTEPGLIGYWRFDEESGEEVFDHSGNGYNGILKNEVGRSISGAPLGDHSINKYDSDFTSQTVSIGVDGQDHLKVSDISSNAKGVQMYRVDALPNNLSGLSEGVSAPYYGLFVCNYMPQIVSYDIAVENTCNSFLRENNSAVSWKKIESDVNDAFIIHGHTDKSEEIIGAKGLNFSLGADATLCPGESILLEIKDVAFERIEWSTGSTERKASVSDSGIIWARIYSDCGASVDSINVFLSEIPSVDLGPDKLVCSQEEVSLELENGNYTRIKWQDGTSNSSYVARSAGTYWVEVENECGVSSDTINIINKDVSNVFLPNVVTANGDKLNARFYVDPQINDAKLDVYNRWGRKVYNSQAYQNDWPTDDIHSGVYFYHLTDNCSNRFFKGMIHVIK